MGDYCLSTARLGEKLKNEAKDCVWKAILEKIDIGEGMQHYVMQYLSKKWRDYKCEQAEVFLITHVHKDGTSVNNDSVEKIREMKDRMTREGSEDSTSTSRNDVCSLVFRKEKHGRV